MKPQLVIALDVPAGGEIPGLLSRLPPEIHYYKIGLELFVSEGITVLAQLSGAGKLVFLDLKLHDIPRTVARAVKAAAKHGAALLTVHSSGGRDMLRAAAEAAKELGNSAPKLVAVTALTSLNDRDLLDVGVSRRTSDHVMALGELAVTSGIDGLVCSPLEAAAFRARFGGGIILVTPGIRQEGSDAGDQKRVSTPSAAVSAGADFLVVGRPVLDAADPEQAARSILAQMARSTSHR